MRSPRGLDEEERVGLELLGAVDEAALAAAQAVPGKVGRAHGEPVSGECLGGDTHTGESCVRTKPVEEEDKALARAATCRRPGPEEAVDAAGAHDL